jgi:cytoplasmic iron level regulating protein YaaA (DUF328/UPF0246 family)
MRVSSFPHLQPARAAVLRALSGLCRNDPDTACGVLGLGPSQAGEIARNAGLHEAPAAKAAKVYTGVLYEALRPQDLDVKSQNRIAVFSGLFGVVRLTDRIPAYRCPAGINLPGIGPLGTFWRTHLGGTLTGGGHGLLIDLRSGPYAAMARLGGAVTVKVVHDGKVVSHFNKATKGALVRDLLAAGADPRTPGQLAADLRELGYTVAEAGGGVLTVEINTPTTRP